MTASGVSRESDGAGVAAGQVVLLALTVCESLALHALDDPVERSGAALQARRLRARVGEALEASSRAYLRARHELEVTLAEAAPPATGRDATLRRALTDAVDGLIALAEGGADAAVLAAGLAAVVEPSRRADAAGAAELGLGAVRCARHLVEVNLALARGDSRREQIDALAATAEQATATARRCLEES